LTHAKRMILKYNFSDKKRKFAYNCEKSDFTRNVIAEEAERRKRDREVQRGLL
jgi:hypothetical protein